MREHGHVRFCGGRARWLRVWRCLAALCLVGCGSIGVKLLPEPSEPTSDAGPIDAGSRDAGRSDAGLRDGSTPDAGSGDAGSTPSDAGPVPSDAGPRFDAAADGGGYVCDAASCEPIPCTDAGTSPDRGICGCGQSDEVDSDGDGAPDCIDFCPGVPDQTPSATCACNAGDEDADSDGTVNCYDRCPFDPAKQSPGECGCLVADTDRDNDGTPDCIDECLDDPAKHRPGVCGCGSSDEDTDLDGTPDCNDPCTGKDDSGYVSDPECGVGYCRDHNLPSTCVAGLETMCTPASPLSATDATCDGVDDDCDGDSDEDYAVAGSMCGLGVCARTGQRSCVAGQIADSCVAGAPTSASDTTCDGVDDNCDGRADEGYASVPTSCGPGACASSGTRACVNGAIVDSCVANMPSGIPETTCNNVDDDCDTRVDENFMSSTTMCGVGECARTGTRTCNAGVLADSCRAGTPSTSVDSSCNNVDNDCDGRIDESFVASDTQCGVGACRSTGRTSCVSGMTRNSCVARTPSTTVDDATVPGNGIDDDCDGRVDENVPACDTSARSYEAGSHTITVPGNCHNVSVRLWGGGGGGGASAGLADGGNGGAGGYATASVLVAGAINLYVGGAGASGCNNAGTNAGSSSYNGGSGGTSTGANGNDGNVSGGGTGGAPSTGARGGNGYYGGGGGGQGSGGLGTSGNGGGGGAASVFIVNGVRAAVAGGGGGGGGAQAITILGTVSAAGGNAGSGCRGNGQAPNANGGGGGGGGACQGASTQSGSGTTPAASGDIPSGRARGGTSSCGAGGAGYAIVTFSP